MNYFYCSLFHSIFQIPNEPQILFEESIQTSADACEQCCQISDLEAAIWDSIKDLFVLVSNAVRYQT